MNKLQHVLIVAGPGQVKNRLPLTDSECFCFSYCAEDNLESELLNSSHPYDWVLLDGKSLHGDQMELVRSLRAIGFFLPATMDSGGSICQLERTDQGVLQLHCCMRTRKRSSTEDQDGCVFEYHAPMTKTG